MQNYYDTATGKNYAFDDSVVVSGAQGAWVFTAPNGAVLGPYPVTLTPGNAPYVAPPAPTLAQQAAALIAGGLTVTSTGTAALDGVYACDAAAQSNLQAVQTYILTNGKFPGSSGTYPWLDVTGTAHIFPSTTEFEAFASRVADFVADCTLIMLTNSGTLPPASATIP